MDTRKHIRKLIYNLYANPLHRALYLGEINKRSKLSLTNIYPLSKKINLFSPTSNELNRSNDWYGHASAFKKFLKLPLNYQFKTTIEHGFYLSSGC